MPPLGGDTGRKGEHTFASSGGFVLICPKCPPELSYYMGIIGAGVRCFCWREATLQPAGVRSPEGYEGKVRVMPNTGDSDLGGFRSLDSGIIQRREQARRDAADAAADRKALAALDRTEAEMLRDMGKTPTARRLRVKRRKGEADLVLQALADRKMDAAAARAKFRTVRPYVRGHMVLTSNPQRGTPKTAESSARAFRAVGLDERYMRPDGGIVVTGTPSRLLGDSPDDAAPTYAEECERLAARWVRKGGTLKC